jgi:dTDP-4-amino-4,6-dideoxygalactose transaminase
MKIEIYSPTIRRKEMDAVLTAMVEEKIGPGRAQPAFNSNSKRTAAF